MGVVPPAAGFNAGLAELCTAHGALLISDEVMTGFRVSRSGWYGIDGVRPDLMTFGKVMGGGFPAAAFGGRADVMALLAPAGPVYQAGTLAGNPVATAAGLATLQACDAAVYTHLDRTAGILQGLVGSALAAEGVPHRVQHAGNMFSVFFVDADVRDFADAQSQDVGQFAAFFHAMLGEGVYLPPSAYETWFVSAAHDDAALDRIAAALPVAARAAAGATPSPGGSLMTNFTRKVIHLLRHGEVHNPTGVLYGRLPGYRLSERGQLMARANRGDLGRARRPAGDLLAAAARAGDRAAARRRPRARDRDRRPPHRGRQQVRGAHVRRRRRSLRRPEHWKHLWNPFRPSWGEPYAEIAPRMQAALHAARDELAAGEAVLVSHQLPIWTLRSHLEGRRLWHDPRKRQCSVASLTSFIYAGERLVEIDYSEPAADLLPLHSGKTFSAGA